MTKKLTFKLICTLFFFLLFLSLSSSTLFAWTGTVIDKDSGEPIAGAVIFRSWYKKSLSPGGDVYFNVTYKEACSDQNGKFSISDYNRFLHQPISFPVGYTPIEENHPAVYKAGYKFCEIETKSEVIKLQKLPASYYLRHEEAEKARATYLNYYYKTGFLKKAVDEEIEFIKSLSRYVPGVFCPSGTYKDALLRFPYDIDIDMDGNLYVADGDFSITLYKISKNGSLINKSTLFNGVTSSETDIEFDKDGNLYAYAKRALIEIDTTTLSSKVALCKKDSNYIFPYYESRFCIADKKIYLLQEDKPFRNNAPFQYLYMYDFEGNLLKKIEVPESNTYAYSFDITTDLNNNIYIAYGSGPSIRLIKFNKKLEQQYDRQVKIDILIPDITIARGNHIIIAGTQKIYVFDKNMDLLYEINPGESELGEIDIRRIKVDPHGERLFIIERAYNRILMYSLKEKRWFVK